MALTELEGQKSSAGRVVIERGPVKVFAEAVKADDPVYREEGAPAPPTFPFAMGYFGSVGGGGAAGGGVPIEQLRGPGRMILHGEQEFVYHSPLRVGQTLHGESEIVEVYEKERGEGRRMEFYVTETRWRDADSGDPVVTTRFTMIVNVRPA